MNHFKYLILKTTLWVNENLEVMIKVRRLKFFQKLQYLANIYKVISAFSKKGAIQDHQIFSSEINRNCGFWMIV